MSKFSLPQNLFYNQGLIQNPERYAAETGCASWLSLTGPEFAALDEGISFEQIRKVVPKSANVISDPPRILDLDLARKMIVALDELPLPTLISCRIGPRASAAAYLYAGLKQNVKSGDVLKAAKGDDAPFYKYPEYREWVSSSLESLRNELYHIS